MMFQSFKFMVKITGKYICESKNWMLIFSHAPKQNSAASFYHYSPPPGKRKLPIPPEQHFLKIYISSGKRGERIMELKKLLKLNLRG